MESTITDTITSVQPRMVTRKRDGQSFTLYDVFTAKGHKFTAGRREVATEAQQLLGQQASLVIRSEQNGQYRNDYLQEVHPIVAPPASVPPYIAQAQAAQPNATGQPTAPTPAPSFPTVADQEAKERARELSIWRQTATKVAAHIAKTPGEFWANVDDLIRFYATGISPQENTAAAPQQQGNQFFPEAEVAQTQKVFSDGRPLPSDDDIPFD